MREGRSCQQIRWRWRTDGHRGGKSALFTRAVIGALKSRLRRPRAGLAACAAAISFLFSATGNAAEDAKTIPLGVANTSWDGLSRFVELARAEEHVERVVAGGTLPYGELQPKDAIVLVHPTETLDVESLTEFLRQGGRVVIFDDFGTSDSLVEHFGIKRIPPPERPKESVRGNASLPVARPSGVHPTIAEVPFVVLNHPTALDHPNLSTVLVVRDTKGHEAVVGVAGAVGKGRLFVVSDASAVMNGMMRFSGNRTFAGAVLKYALEDDAWGERGGVLYILSDAFATRGSLAPRGPVAEFLERALARLKDEARKTSKEGLGPDLAWIGTIAAAAMILMWLRKRAGTLHRIELPRWGRPVSDLAEGGVGGHAALLKSSFLTRTLEVIEWKNALEETVAARLDAMPLPPQNAWVARLVDEQWIDRAAAIRLQDALMKVATIETAQLARGAVREPSSGEVGAIVAVFEEILSRLEGRTGRPHP